MHSLVLLPVMKILILPYKIQPVSTRLESCVKGERSLARIVRIEPIAQISSNLVGFTSMPHEIFCSVRLVPLVGACPKISQLIHQKQYSWSDPKLHSWKLSPQKAQKHSTCMFSGVSGGRKHVYLHRNLFIAAYWNMKALNRRGTAKTDSLFRRNDHFEAFISNVLS
jgi:hypothetical protein